MADLLALDLAGIAGDEAGDAQRAPKRLVELDQRGAMPWRDRAGLAHPSTVALDVEAPTSCVSSSGWRTIMRPVRDRRTRSSERSLTVICRCPA